MNQALANKPKLNENPATSLVVLLERGDLSTANELTAEMAIEAKEWGKSEVADKVKLWWIEQYRRKLGADAARDADAIWLGQPPAAELMAQIEAKAGEMAKALEASEAKLYAEPKSPEADEEEEPEAEPEAKPEPEPESSALIALPGIAGELQNYYLRTAQQPSDILSVAVGLMVPTVLVSANVIGPSGPEGCALQQTVVALAPTSGGKQRVIDVSKLSVSKAGAKKLLGPNRFKSGAALVRWVKGNPVSLSIQDEYGSLLKKLGNPKANPCEVEINDRMREMWALGPNSIYNSPVGAGEKDDMMAIEGVRFSVLGFGVPEEFFDACKDVDIVNGFLNRITVLEEPKMMRPRSDFAQGEFPFKLMENLCKLHSIKPRRLGWGAGAEEIYEAELDRVFNETDESRRKLWSRTPEKINRAASTFATSRLDTKVERSDMEVAQAIMRHSDRVFQRGIDKARKNRELTHAELRHEIARRLVADFFNRQASTAELKHSFRHNTKFKGAVEDALKDMRDTKMVEYVCIKTGGRDKWVNRLIDE